MSEAGPPVGGPGELSIAPLSTARPGGGWWGSVASLHRDVALCHQSVQLDRFGALEAFAIAAGRVDGVPSAGLVTFISDSDVHKWLDAVARSLPGGVPEDVLARFDEVVELVGAAQRPDGYLSTWIQTMFPGGEFQNLLTEHELYTVGHLVEAAVSLLEATGDDRLLCVAVPAVDVVRRAVATWSPTRQDGHPEIELALVRLHRATGDPDALTLARDLLDRRGTCRSVRRQSVGDHLRTGRRLLRQWALIRRYRRSHPGWRPSPRATVHDVGVSPSIGLRTVASFVSGRQWQNDRPVRRLTEPSGHAVAFHYLQTAMAMVAAETGDRGLRSATEAAWASEVAGHMFVTGGVGAMPGVEGFAAPLDLDPERAYCETCAGISGVMWNRELGALTGDARYDDLAEWQLLNAAAVGISTTGDRYGYNNPLQVSGPSQRAEWFATPCCPSNLTRLWATTPASAVARRAGTIQLRQFVSGRTTLGATTIEVDSQVPWEGSVRVRFSGDELPGMLDVRVPSWSGGVTVEVDGQPVDIEVGARPSVPPTASGIAPHAARWARVDLGGVGSGSIEVTLGFETPIRLLRQDPRMPLSGGRVAVTRGPLVFCVEAVDHPHLSPAELFGIRLDATSLSTRPAPDLHPDALALHGHDTGGRPVRLVPYMLWGNRTPGPMTVFVDVA